MKIIRLFFAPNLGIIQPMKKEFYFYDKDNYPRVKIYFFLTKTSTYYYTVLTAGTNPKSSVISWYHLQQPQSMRLISIEKETRSIARKNIVRITIVQTCSNVDCSKIQKENSLNI